MNGSIWTSLATLVSSLNIQDQLRQLLNFSEAMAMGDADGQAGILERFCRVEKARQPDRRSSLKRYKIHKEIRHRRGMQEKSERINSE
jgi:hypothetical protein